MTHSYWLKEEEVVNKVFEYPKNLQYVKKKYLTNENCLHFMKVNPKVIEFLPEEFQTFEICKIAIDNGLFNYVKNQSSKVCKYAIKIRPLNLEYVINQTYKLCKYAINEDPECIQVIRNQKRKLCYLALDNDGSVLKHILKPNYKMCKIAIKQEVIMSYDNVFQYIPEKFRTKKIIKYGLKYDKSTLKYIDDLTDEMLSISIKYNYDTLFYIDNPTKELCLKSLKKFGRALNYIENPTYEMCLLACKNTTDILLNIIPLEHKTDEICEIEFNKNSRSIEYIPNQTNDMCLKAIKDNPNHLPFIKNQTEEICKIALSKNIYLLLHLKIKIDLSFLFKKISIPKEKYDVCPLCNEEKMYYANYNCDIKHYLCLDCLRNLNCYYKCKTNKNFEHNINLDVLWYNVPEFE